MAVEAVDQNPGHGFDFLFRFPELLGRRFFPIGEKGGDLPVLPGEIAFPPLRDALAEGLPVGFQRLVLSSLSSIQTPIIRYSLTMSRLTA
jgi:hypothetical protein